MKLVFLNWKLYNITDFLQVSFWKDNLNRYLYKPDTEYFFIFALIVNTIQQIRGGTLA